MIKSELILKLRAKYSSLSLNDIEKILYDLELRNSLITNGSRYVEKFLVNRGNASENLAEYLGKSQNRIKKLIIDKIDCH